MSERRDTQVTFTALVCRGCCCARGELESSANEQLAAVRAAAAIVPGARVRLTDCLGPCSSKNVIAIRHRRLDTPGVRHGTTWLGGFGDDAPLDAIAAWLGDGARREALPSRLEAHRLDESTVAPDELLRVLPRAARQEAASADGRR